MNNASEPNARRLKFETWLNPWFSRNSSLDGDGDVIYDDDWVQGAWFGFYANSQSLLDDQVLSIINAEREACALICDKISDLNLGRIELDAAAAQIRARK